VLALNTQFLGLDIDVDGVDIIDATLLRGLFLDPVAKLVVDGVTTSLAFLIVVIIQAELLLKLTGKLGLTELDGFLAHIDSPFVVLNLDFHVDFGCLGLHLLEFIVTACITVFDLIGAWVRAIIAAAAVAVLLGGAILLGLAGSLALSLVLLALLGLVLQDEAAELEAKVNIGALTAGLAIENNVVILDNDIGFGILALLAEDELVDESIQMILELGGLMGTIDDPAIVFGIHVGLCSQFKAEELDHVGTRAGE
jgi:hypothetical protein